MAHGLSDTDGGEMRVSESQSLWRECVSEILHDTTGFVSILGHYEQRVQEQQHDLSADRQGDRQKLCLRIANDLSLIRYLGHSASTFPMTAWAAELFLTRMQSVLQHGPSYYYGYDLRKDVADEARSLVPECPAFVLSTVLATMLFRIPAGLGGEKPTEVLARAHLTKGEGGIPRMQFSMEMTRAFTHEQMQSIQIEPYTGRWDCWHHSWYLASRWAEKYGGRCRGTTGREKRLCVAVELPLATKGDMDLTNA